MSTAAWIIVGIAALIASAIALEAYLKRNRRRTLSSIQPKRKDEKVALGQEATDAELVKRTHDQNQKTEHRNGALGRRL